MTYAPMNGTYIDSTGQLRNIDGTVMTASEAGWSPFNGDYIRSDGSIGNIDELGGGGGTSNYSALTGKPQINGVTLASGDNTPESLKLSYTFTQSTEVDVWIIPHNLGRQFVNIQVVDNSGNTLIPSPEYTSVNVVTLTFANPVQGTAIIRR
jgi:hypothetical protein